MNKLVRPNHFIDTSSLLKEFAEKFHWNNDGTDSLLNIGCGNGAETIDYILPIMPTNFKCLSGCDISKENIDIASQTYQMDNVTFFKLDPGCDLIMDEPHLISEFSHVISIYNLNSIQDQRRGIENIYDLLTESGECLLIISSWDSLAHCIWTVMDSEKWQPYFENCGKSLKPYQIETEPLLLIQGYLRTIGFNDIFTEERQSTAGYETSEDLENNFITSYGNILNNVPKDMQHELYCDILEFNKNFNQSGGEDNISNMFSSKTIIAFARK